MSYDQICKINWVIRCEKKQRDPNSLKIDKIPA